MSRAFLRESDLEEKPIQPKRQSPLTPGAKNLVTRGGWERLRQELERLVETERPALAAAKDESGVQLEAMDERIRYLQNSLQTSEIVAAPPLGEERAKVRFGASVTVRDRAGTISNYRLVGVDETEVDKGWISFLSPLARVLMNARVGQRVTFRAPSGVSEMEVVSVDYPDV
jgi:transcription elongation factor GreB